MGSTGRGVEVRESSIRLIFRVEGKRMCETLKTDGKPLAPTPANIRYANRVADEIRQKIRFGTYVHADYFPDSEHSTSGRSITRGEQLDKWLLTQAHKANSTLKGYRVAVDWWKQKLVPELPLKTLKHSDILLALASEPTWSGKTRNNKSSVLRLALQLAVRDGDLAANPINGLEPAEHQAPQPDPFSIEEVDLILAGMAKHYGPQIEAYFGAKFFSGLRTSESLAMRWENVDWRRKQLLVADAVVLGVFKTSTKTNASRIVQLNSRAMACLKAQKPHTFMQDHGWIFPDPRTGQRWTDDEPPRELYWRPMLKRLGIRYRSPYQTRHTYATMLLMAGVTPAYAAKQMGHTIEMFLRTYAKWIDGGHNALEMGKLEDLLSPSSQKAAHG